MKKLMIAAAIVCAAVVSQAGMVDWNIDSCLDEYGDEITSGYYAFLINDADYSRDDAVAQINLGSIDFLKSSGNYLASQEFNYGCISYTTDETAIADSGTVSLYTVIINDDLSNADYAYITPLEEDISIDMEVAAYDLTDLEPGTNDWVQLTLTPEPTSGLLLLIGMAGLALRRRRA